LRNTAQKFAGFSRSHERAKLAKNERPSSPRRAAIFAEGKRRRNAPRELPETRMLLTQFHQVRPAAFVATRRDAAARFAYPPPDAGHPLPARYRAEMETQLSADLREVHIHVSPWASAACLALGARAFAWGRNVAFAEGQFAPETLPGRWILAHELAHVIQQMRAGVASDARPSFIGSPLDPHEDEACAAADRAMQSSGPAPVLTPDRTGALRRAITIDRNSAKLTIDRSAAVPNVSVGRVVAVCHLTKGFTSADANQNNNGDAFTIEGQVNVFVDTKAEADLVSNNWTFNFIQVVQFNSWTFSHEGRRDSEGEVFTTIATPPALPTSQKVGLDAPQRSLPFVKSASHAAVVFRPQNNKVKVEVKNSMGDHPTTTVPLTAPNSITKTLNFLLEMEDDLDFFSVFVARDDKGIFQDPIAHVHWQLKNEARFKWLRNRPTGVYRGPGLKFDLPIIGGPTDAAVKAILANPVAPTAAQNLAQALANSVNILNKQDSAKRSLLIPKDFFR
jgi:hypothetical protein